MGQLKICNLKAEKNKLNHSGCLLSQILFHCFVCFINAYTFIYRGVARKCVMLKPNTFFQLKLLVFHNFFSERPGEIPYLKKSR